MSEETVSFGKVHDVDSDLTLKIIGVAHPEVKPLEVTISI